MKNVTCPKFTILKINEFLNPKIRNYKDAGKKNWKLNLPAFTLYCPTVLVAEHTQIRIMRVYFEIIKFNYLIASKIRQQLQVNLDQCCLLMLQSCFGVANPKAIIVLTCFIFVCYYFLSYTYNNTFQLEFPMQTLQ